MRKIIFCLTPLLLLMAGGKAFAQSEVTDSVDVLHYDIVLDMGNQVERQVQGTAEITFVLTRDCDAITFDLICDRVSPVSLDGVVIRGFNYDRDNALLSIRLSGGGQAGDTHVVSIPYVTNGYVENYGWGGLHMDRQLYYNLGVAFGMHPHVFGRAWFPCRDNFYDKATYSLTVTSQPGWRALCGGIRQSETANSDGSNTSVWTIDQPTPTYLVSVSSAEWSVIEREFEGLYDTYPAYIGYLNKDSSEVESAFDILDDVIPMYERAWGPYRWGRIGYIATPQGSMEHVNNIGLVDQCISHSDVACQMTMCHELGHAWFGNLVTCSTEGDMWINEGGASFCEELAAEAAYGRGASTQRYVEKLGSVIRSTHMTDGGYRALSGMHTNYTYGSTTYDKGAVVWHSIRGIMGDSLFYSCMNRLFAQCAFGNIDAYALRDSLSLYSGIDLEGFFDFHVFHAGFVDYAIDLLEVDGDNATLTLRQLLRGTDHYAHGNRVPVTFFSYDLQQQEKRWMVFDDSVATETFALPFVAAFAVVDYDREISDACTDNATSLQERGTKSLGNCFCKILVPDDTDNPKAWVHVGLHYAHPTGQMPEGVTRVADRYWQVTGFVPWEMEYTGRFLYNMGSNGSEGAANLDLGFYDNRYTLDSLALLYRPTPQEPWRLVSQQRTSSSGITNGYFTARFLTGQYTLAVVDSATVGIPTPLTDKAEMTVKLSPNPSKDGRLRVEVANMNEKFDLLIFDMQGKKVLQMNNIRNGEMLHHDLPAGSYVVIIQNKCVFLQSQIIVQ